MGTSAALPVEPTKVEAAKDRKKPKIKFKGSKNISAEVGEKVTIPKTTYSDNITKKKKLKVGVTVKKGKKNYKTIANKIKKATVNNKTVVVEFPEDGTYKITYSVADAAKNVATKTRTVVVNQKEIITEEEIITKEDPITEEPVRKVVTTEEPTTTEAPTTTEQPKTEEPKKEEKIDLSEYADYETVEINNNDYNIVTKLKKEPGEVKTDDGFVYLNYSNVPVENAYSIFPVRVGVGNDSEYLYEDYFPLYLVGKIKAGFIMDDDAKTFIDWSDNVLLDYLVNDYIIKIYVVDNDGNFYYMKDILYYKDNFYTLKSQGKGEFDTFDNYSINEESQVIAAPGLSSNEITIKTKKLILNKIDLGKRDD